MWLVISVFIYFQSDDNASFLRAARGGNLEKVLEYLKANTDINTCNAVSCFRKIRMEWFEIGLNNDWVIIYSAANIDP